MQFILSVDKVILVCYNILMIFEVYLKRHGGHCEKGNKVYAAVCYEFEHSCWWINWQHGDEVFSNFYWPVLVCHS